jgi:hypothetical protein
MTILLGLLAGYFVLNYSFMQLRLPPSSVGVPLGEIFLLLFLATCNLPLIMGRLGQMVTLAPFLAWWSYGIGRAVVDSFGNGLWAFRDATQVLESLYILVGFAIAGRPENVDRLFHWLRWIVVAVLLYSMTYFVGNEITRLSPKVPGGSGQPIPLFGIYGNVGTVLIWSSAYLVFLAHDTRLTRRWGLLLAPLPILYALIVFQARTTYIQLVVICAIVALLRPAALKRMAVALPLFFLVVGIIMLAEVKVMGRLSGEISFSFFADHALSILGISNSQETVGAARGVAQRLLWWSRIEEKLTVDLPTLVLGLGYGNPLVDFATPESVQVREPHNSLISTVARIGVLGIALWLWMHFELLRRWLSTFKRARRIGTPLLRDRLLFLLSYCLLVLAMAVGEDPLEKPFFVIPYYLFWGVMLRIGFELSRTQQVAALTGGTSSSMLEGPRYARRMI